MNVDVFIDEPLNDDTRALSSKVVKAQLTSALRRTSEDAFPEGRLSVSIYTDHWMHLYTVLHTFL